MALDWSFRFFKVVVPQLERRLTLPANTARFGNHVMTFFISNEEFVESNDNVVDEGDQVYGFCYFERPKVFQDEEPIRI